MKANVIKRFPLSICILGMLSFQSCKKDALQSNTSDKNELSYANAIVSSSTTSYMVSTVVGGNTSSGLAVLPYPFYICSEVSGSMFVTLPFSNVIYKVSPQGIYRKYLNYNSPSGIKAGANGSLYFISRFLSNDGHIDTNAIVKVDRNKKITVLKVNEKLTQILDLAIAPDSSIYIPDYQNQRIIKLTKQGVTSILAGKKGVSGYADGQGENAHFTYPTYVKFGEDGNLWVVDGAGSDVGQSIRKVSQAGLVTTLYRLKPDYKNLHYIVAFAVTKRDKDFNLSPHENVIFFVRSFSNGNKVVSNQLFHLSYNKVLTPITGNISENDPLKDGPAAMASFNTPTGITVNPNGIFVADQVHSAIRKIARQ
ncbi:hypothetical protein [Mucilaginibacter pocheonensis]|uniref:DNA-binding beta-propeller fold protein YncE n=1 Tax=Mucilaginibacter pocheonensis TaxID=398050 RepID=A0ABU1T629_9SPHI|nr:hypothetical protein [Mucilaginibacter pocheonensis]MDR6940842.1 hypothetical protein [Mucilaginibacter pocheonensis]